MKPWRVKTNIDERLLLAYLIILVAGLIMVYSSSSMIAESRFGSHLHFLRNQATVGGPVAGLHLGNWSDRSAEAGGLVGAGALFHDFAVVAGVCDAGAQRFAPLAVSRAAHFSAVGAVQIPGHILPGLFAVESETEPLRLEAAGFPICPDHRGRSHPDCAGAGPRCRNRPSDVGPRHHVPRGCPAVSSGAGDRPRRRCSAASWCSSSATSVPACSTTWLLSRTRFRGSYQVKQAVLTFRLRRSVRDGPGRRTSEAVLPALSAHRFHPRLDRRRDRIHRPAGGSGRPVLYALARLPDRHAAT